MDNFNNNGLEIQQNEAEIQYVNNGKKLWNTKSFIWLSAFFSFLPAGILYSLNYGRLGNAKKRNLYMLSSFIIFAIMFALGYFIPASGMKTVFYALNIGLGIYMYQDQTKVYKEHLEKGGKKASLIIPVIICIAFSASIIWCVIYSSYIPDKVVKINGDELYYTSNISVDEAKKLGDYLDKNGLFIDDNKSLSAKIDKQSDKYIFSIPINKEYLDDKESLDYFSLLAQQLSTDLFNSKVEIELCDGRFKPLKVIDK